MAVPSHMLGRHVATFTYTNWKGETQVRKVVPDRVVWLNDPDYGYKPGWFLQAWCLDRDALREFSLDPAHMMPGAPLSTHGVNILLQVR